MFQFVLNNVRILTTIFVTIYLLVSIFFDAKLCRPRQPRYTQLYHIFLIYVHDMCYIVHRDVLEMMFAVRWSDRMQWTKITRQTVHDAMTGNDNDARYRKGRRYILTIGKMHARMLVREDGFGTIASSGTAAQSAGVTSPRSSP